MSHGVSPESQSVQTSHIDAEMAGLIVSAEPYHTTDAPANKKWPIVYI